MELDVFLERLDAVPDDPRVGGERPGHVTHPMAVVAPTRIQRPTPLDARGERAEPLGKHRLAGAYSRRARHSGALGCEVRRDRCGGAPRVAEAVVTRDRFGIR